MGEIAHMKMNRYDFIVLLLIFSLCFGNLGGALQVCRILAILLAPMMLKFQKKHSYISKNVIRYLIFFYIYCLISLVWTPDFNQALKELLYYPVHFLLFMEIVVFSFKANRGCRSLSMGWMCAVFFCSIIAFWEISTGNHLSIANEQGGMRHLDTGIFEQMSASVTFGNYNSFVTFLCFCFPWLFYLSMVEKSFVLRFLPFCSILLAIIVILYDASRGGILTFFVMLLIYIIKTPGNIVKYISVILFSVLLIYIMLTYGGDTIQIIEARAGDGASLEATGRKGIWICAFYAFLNSYGIGTGVGSITAAMTLVDPNGVASPHNFFLELLTQYGFILFFLFVMFLIHLFIRSLKTSGAVKIALLMVFIAMPIYSIIDSTFLLGANLYGFWGTVYYFANQKQNIDTYKVELR